MRIEDMDWADIVDYIESTGVFVVITREELERLKQDISSLMVLVS